MGAARNLLGTFIALAMGFTSFQAAEAAQNHTVMRVSATVVDGASVFAIQHVQSVLVTDQDIRKGHVDVPVGSRIRLGRAQSCAIQFMANGNFFASISVSGAGPAARLEPGGSARLPGACHFVRARSVDLDYRFELAPGARPGLYRWPISMSILPR